MSYQLEVDLPSCCAENLHLIAEISQCTLEQALVMVCMVGMQSFAAWNLTPTTENMQAICDATRSMFHGPLKTVWE